MLAFISILSSVCLLASPVSQSGQLLTLSPRSATIDSAPARKSETSDSRNSIAAGPSVARGSVPPPSYVEAGADAAGSDRPVEIWVGLGSSAPGTPKELEALQQLTRSLALSARPKTEVHRVPANSGTATRLCRKGSAELVVLLVRAPISGQRVHGADELRIRSWDCATRKQLGDRSVAAGGETGLANVLWVEAGELRARRGVRGGRTGLVRRSQDSAHRARAILVASGAAVLLGLAVGLVVAGIARDERVVLTVAPR